MSPRFDACFLDVDGVIQDLEQLGDQWSDLCGQALEQRLGGRAEGWALAQRQSFERVWAEREAWSTDPAARHADQSYALLGTMCRLQRQPAPSRELAARLMRDIEVDVLRRCSAVFPGSRETLIELSRTVALHTASGNLSWRIEALLDGLGVTRLVGLRAGPDLVGAAKRTLRFYERLFELARVPPERALIVEDDPTQIELALELRAHAVHVRAAPSCGCGADGHLASLNELPEWIFDA